MRFAVFTALLLGLQATSWAQTVTDRIEPIQGWAYGTTVYSSGTAAHQVVCQEHFPGFPREVGRVVSHGDPATFQYFSPWHEDKPTLTFLCNYTDGEGNVQEHWHGTTVEWNWSCPAGYQAMKEDTAAGSDPYTFCGTTGVVVGKPEDPCCEKAGNPIVVQTRRKVQHELDYEAGNGSMLRFERVYWSAAPGKTQSYSQSRALFGAPFWRHSFDKRLYGTLVDGAAPIRPSHYTPGRSSYFPIPPPAAIAGQNPTGTVAALRPDGTRAVFFSFEAARDIGYSLAPGTLPGSDAVIVLTTPSNDEEFYDSAGRLLAIRTASGEVLRLSYANGQLVDVADEFGHTLSFLHDDSGRLTAMIDPANVRTEYTYNSNGDFASVTYAAGTLEAATRTYHYVVKDSELTRLLSGITDERGVRFSTWTYTDEGYAFSSEHAGGVERTEIGLNGQSYAEFGDNPYVKNALGLVTNFDYQTINGSQRLISKSRTLDDGTVESSSRSYDADGVLTSMTDWNGTQTTYVSGARGLTEQITQAAGRAVERTVSYEWDTRYRLPSRVVRPLSSVDIERGAFVQPTRTTMTDLTDGSSRQSTRNFDSAGRLLSSNGPRNDVADIVSVTYHMCTSGEECGRPATMTNALGHVTLFETYDAHGRLLQMTDANGVVITLAYDRRGRVVARTVAGQQTAYTYDPVGNLIGKSEADGTSLVFGYDSAARLVSVTDGEGNMLDWTLDAAGNRTVERLIDSSGTLAKRLERNYSSLSRMVGTIAAHGGTVTYEHDASNNITALVDAAGRRTVREFDALDRLIKETDPLGGETQFTYDTQDNLLSVTDPEGKTTTYTYNGFDDLLSVSSPDTGVTTYTVDEAGNRLSQTDARGVTVNYSYDALNRRISESFSDSTLDIQYTYDQGAYGEGRLTGISDASGSTDYGYDARGNLTAITTTINGQSYSQSYSYNGANRLTDMTYPSGRTVSYTYDNSGRIDQIDSGNETLADTITRLPFGPTTGLTLGNGIIQSRNYDQDYRVLNITDGLVLSRNYGYNTVDNITAITDSLSPAISQLFTYDDLDRLDFAAGDYGDKSYSYDGIGNRQSLVSEKNGTTQTQAYSYASNSHQLTSVSNGPSFQYDAVGNTTAKGSIGFAYNDRNRLSSAVVNGATFTYTHNALGQRVRKSGSIGDTHYVYDLEGRLIMEADGSGTVVAEYSYLDGEPLTMWRDSTTPTAPSILQNGGFESGLNNWISCSNSGSTQVVSDPSEGSSALQVTSGDCLYQEFSVTPDISYVLECDAKGALTQYTSVALTIMDQSFTNLIDQEVEVTSSSYQSFGATLTAPTAGAIGAVTFYSDDIGVFDGCTVVPQNSTTPPTPPPPVSSLLVNGGFESGLTDWLSCSSSGTTQTVSDPTEGTNALQITGSDCLYQEFAVTPNESYTLQCDAKGALTQYTSVALTIMDQSFSSLIADEVEVTSSAYQSYSTTVAAPGAGAIGAVTFYSEDTGVFDNCTVVEE